MHLEGLRRGGVPRRFTGRESTGQPGDREDGLPDGLAWLFLYMCFIKEAFLGEIGKRCREVGQGEE